MYPLFKSPEWSQKLTSKPQTGEKALVSGVLIAPADPQLLWACGLLQCQMYFLRACADVSIDLVQRRTSTMQLNPHYISLLTGIVI